MFIANATPAVVSGGAVAWDLYGWTNHEGFFGPLVTTALGLVFLVLWQFAYVGAAVTAAVLVRIWCIPGPRAPSVPRHSSILYLVLGVLSVVFFVWKIGSGQAADSHRLGVALIVNAGWLGGGGLLHLWAARHPSLLSNVLFHAFLFAGLFLVAFPLGIAPKSFLP